jgi:hypothetical protein
MIAGALTGIAARLSLNVVDSAIHPHHPTQQQESTKQLYLGWHRKALSEIRVYLCNNAGSPCHSYCFSEFPTGLCVCVCVHECYLRVGVPVRGRKCVSTH